MLQIVRIEIFPVTPGWNLKKKSVICFFGEFAGAGVDGWTEFRNLGWKHQVNFPNAGVE